MKVTDFAKDVAIIEGRKKQVSIAQIMEILRIINKLTYGQFYKLIRGM